MSGYCDDCGNTMCICDDTPCPVCGEKSHLMCGAIGQDLRDARIKYLEDELSTCNEARRFWKLKHKDLEQENKLLREALDWATGLITPDFYNTGMHQTMRSKAKEVRKQFKLDGEA